MGVPFISTQVRTFELRIPWWLFPAGITKIPHIRYRAQALRINNILHEITEL